MTTSPSYLFGPVPSRRLGSSLGVDIVPLKTCTQNCVYCELGINAETTLERRSYIPLDDLFRQFREFLDRKIPTDYITVTGSGEPTLNSDLGAIIDRIRTLTQIPVAILTNGTLLWNPAVRRDCAKADVVLPSLDAPDPETFEKINKPHPDLNFDAFVTGLEHFRRDYPGQIWLEVFLIDGVNTSPAHIEGFRRLIDRIGPDKVQLNTAVRPTAQPNVLPIPPEQLEHFAAALGPKAEVVASVSRIREFLAAVYADTDQAVLELLRRRPCTLEDISTGLGIHINEALKSVTRLQDDRRLVAEPRGGKTYFKASDQ